MRRGKDGKVMGGDASRRKYGSMDVRQLRNGQEIYAIRCGEEKDGRKYERKEK